MANPKKYTDDVNGTQVDFYHFSVPMMHEDFHTAEGMGLEYAYFSAEGNDYWDYDMVFVKKELVEMVQKWHSENMW